MRYKLISLSEVKMSLKVAIICCCLVALTHAGPRVRRLANGESAEPGQYPYYVSLYYKSVMTKDPILFCGGAILNERWVLTAAYCYETGTEISDIVVKAGNIYLIESSENEQLSDIEAWFLHPQYTNPLGSFDIALLKLATPLKFNEFVAPIGLPKYDTVPSGTGEIAGLGSLHSMMEMESPESLKYLSLEIIDNQQCQKMINKLLGEEKNYMILDSLRFCTKPTPKNQGYCLQDSGNVLAEKQNGKSYAVGIASFGFAADCETPGAPSIFTRVSAFTNWIESTTEQN